MRYLFSFLVFLCFQSSLLGCSKNEAAGAATAFDSIPTVVAVVPLIAEASGIAASKTNKGHLWVQEDGGGNKPPQLHLLAYDGKVAKTVYLKGLVNRDWEDIALSDGYLYLAETGDNLKRYADYKIYKFPEPTITTDTVTTIETIRFTYPEGTQDAEAILADPVSKNIYIFVKANGPTPIYAIKHPYSTTGTNTATLVGTVPQGGIVSAALSANSKEIILKTYTALYHYTRSEGETIEAAVQKKHTLLPYRLEPQGEAVTFANDNSGYFTLSEKGFFNKVELYFYRRTK